MEVKLREAFKIGFDAVDFTGKMSIYGLSSYMQQIAADHASDLDFNFYKNAGDPQFYWIISKVKYVMTSYLEWEEEMEMETYPGGYDKLFAVRLFDIYSQAGQKIGYIIGYYILMDAERMRPVRIKGNTGALSILDFPYEGEKLQKIKLLGEQLKVETRKAYYSEMDLNGHMNNSHYVKWAVDMLPFECFATHQVKCLEINYNASIEQGTEVKLSLLQKDSTTYMVSGDSLDDEKNYFMAEMILEVR